MAIVFILIEHVYTPTLASILSLQYLFYRAQLKCVYPLKHRNISQVNKRRILYNSLLLLEMFFVFI